MNEGDPNDQSEKDLSDLDLLIGAAKKLNQRAKEEGRSTVPSPELDQYINRKKKEAGSPKSAQNQE